MYQHVSAEAFARPEIFRDVGVRRCGVGPVHYLEVVVTHTGGKLGQQHHVAELHPRKREAAVIRGEVASGEVAVGLEHLFGHLRAERVPAPALIILE